MAASVWLTWPQWIELFGEIKGVKTSYKQISVDEMDAYAPGGVGREIGEMYEFSSGMGYNAKQKDTLMRWDLEKVCSIKWSDGRYCTMANKGRWGSKLRRRV